METSSHSPDSATAALGMAKSLLDLPDELLFKIIQHIGPKSVVTLSLCSTRLNQLCHDSKLWRKADFTSGDDCLSVKQAWVAMDFLLPTTVSLAMQAKDFSKQIVTKEMLLTIKSKCPNLHTLELIDWQLETRLNEFPSQLLKLSIIGCKPVELVAMEEQIANENPVVHVPHTERSYFYDLLYHIPRLQSIDLTMCRWLDNHSLLALSKLPCLRELVLNDCFRVGSCIAYTSLASGMGFYNLERLDMRNTRVDDGDLKNFLSLPNMQEIYFGLDLGREDPRVPLTERELLDWDTAQGLLGVNKDIPCYQLPEEPGHASHPFLDAEASVDLKHVPQESEEKAESSTDAEKQPAAIEECEEKAKYSMEAGTTDCEMPDNSNTVFIAEEVVADKENEEDDTTASLLPEDIFSDSLDMEIEVSTVSEEKEQCDSNEGVCEKRSRIIRRTTATPPRLSNNMPELINLTDDDEAACSDDEAACNIDKGACKGDEAVCSDDEMACSDDEAVYSDDEAVYSDDEAASSSDEESSSSDDEPTRKKICLRPSQPSCSKKIIQVIDLSSDEDEIKEIKAVQKPTEAREVTTLGAIPKDKGRQAQRNANQLQAHRLQTTVPCEPTPGTSQMGVHKASRQQPKRTAIKHAKRKVLAAVGKSKMMVGLELTALAARSKKKLEKIKARLAAASRKQPADASTSSSANQKAKPVVNVLKIHTKRTPLEWRMWQNNRVFDWEDTDPRFNCPEEDADNIFIAYLYDGQGPRIVDYANPIDNLRPLIPGDRITNFAVNYPICEHLRILCATGCSSINDTFLAKLGEHECCKNLQLVDVRETNVTEDGVTLFKGQVREEVKVLL